MKYKRPCVTADVILLHPDNMVLLVKRGNDPFKGKWSLPGGHFEVDLKETLKQTAFRELKEETGIEAIDLRYFGYYDTPGRDPRGSYITHVFFDKFPLLQIFNLKVQDGETEDLKFFKTWDLPDMAFDHKKIMDDFLNRVPYLLH